MTHWMVSNDEFRIGADVVHAKVFVHCDVTRDKWTHSVARRLKSAWRDVLSRLRDMGVTEIFAHLLHTSSRRKHAFILHAGLRPFMDTGDGFIYRKELRHG